MIKNPIKEEARKYGIPFWKVPDFLVLMMAVINIAGMFFTYYFALGIFEDPRIAVIFVAFQAISLLIISSFMADYSRKVISNYRLKEEFVDLISHQIRNPITSIKWNLELFSNEKITKKQREYLKRITGSTENIFDLVNDFVYLSRLDRTQKEIDIQRVDFKKVLESLLKEMEIFIESKKIKVKKDIKNKSYMVRADRKRLKIVLNNIIENALKYSHEEGRIELKIKEDGDKIIFSIKDYGCGIENDSKPYIFEKFYRSANARRRSVDGTGVGLYISNVLIKEMNGKIWFFSKEGKGSTFYLSLPIS